MNRKHPYTEYESTQLWQILDQGITDLVENNDLKETTSRVYIVGYLCKLLTENQNEILKMVKKDN